MKKITVTDVMTRNPVTANPDDNLFECAKKMIRKKVGNLVLIEKKDKKVVGFLSQRDILWALIKKSKKELKDIKAKDVSVRKIFTIKPTEGIQEALGRMNKKRVKRLPVVEKGKKLIGIISVKDILTFKPEFYPELEEFAKIREEQEKLNRIKSKEIAIADDGICGECGERDTLYRSKGMLICESCKNSM